MTPTENLQKNKTTLSLLLTLAAAGSVFLFPGLVATVDSAGSVIFVLLLLVGLVGFRGGWNSLEFWEKALMAGFILFLAAALLSLVNADDLKYGLRRLEKLVRLLALVPVYLSIRHWKIDLVRSFFYGCLLAGPLMLCFSLWQGISSRTVGAYNPIVFGDQAMVLAAVLGASLCFSSLRRGIWPLILLSLLCALAASGFSGSRGGWLALPLLVGIWLWAVRGAMKRWVKVLLFVFFLATVAGLSTTENPVKDRFRQAYSDISRFHSGTHVNTPIGDRFLMWRLATDVWRENPILGTGLGDFQYEEEQRIDAGETRLDRVWPHAHSIYFEYLATTGLAGLLSMMGGLLVVPALFFFREIKNGVSSARAFPALAGLGCVVCFAVFGLTEAWTARSTLLTSYIVCVLVFASGLFSRPHSDFV